MANSKWHPFDKSSTPRSLRLEELRTRMANGKFLGIGYLITIIGLFLYSFTQIDLGLTLTQLSIWQIAQKFFQQIGYFNRPLSTVFFLAIVFLLFTFYILFLVSSDRLAKKTIWTLILISAILLGFSYNAFSYDLFNYIFDAKIVTRYNLNPYEHKALDFPGDPMLSFMHWTHRLYPYGPAWLGLTIPLSFLGFQYFLLTFFLFKGLAVASYLGASFFIGKIFQKIKKEGEIFGIVFFALNPLVIIESLVSGHNDIAMIFFSIFAFYLLISKRYFLAFLMLLVSGLIKFATFSFLPLFIAVLILQKQKKEIPWTKIWFFSIALMIFAIVFASSRTNFQPWYLLFALPFAAFVGKKYFILIPVLIFSLFSLLQYAPFLYLGNWDKPVPEILFWLTVSPIIFSLFFILVLRLKKVLK